jgi:hypothetical protein
MRNGEVHVRVSRWIIDPRMERPVWLEELRLKFNLALNVDRPNRRPEPHNLVYELYLRRRRKIHARLRAEPRIEEIRIVLDSNFLERFVGKVSSFFGRILFVGIKPPPRATKQGHHNNEQNNDLPGCFPFRIQF